MNRFKYIFICNILFIFLLVSCSDKLTPEQEENKQRNEILNQAPINSDYEIIPPSENLPDILKEFSGHWVGKWNDVIPSQLVVTDISSDEVTFIYSWAASPQREIEAGSMERTIKIDSDAKIEFERGDALFSFVINPTLHKVIGAQIKGDDVSNIVMEKVK